jgi:hypothetical protein
MILKRLALILMGTAILFPAYAEEGRPHEEKHAPPAGLLQLSPGMQQLLSREMVALQEGMQALVPAIVSGQWKVIADVAKQMRDSYILAQELTPAQVEELHHSLPLSFRSMDQEFHHHAGMLAHAADNRNPELVAFYYYKMTDSCLSCHRAFATHRFPPLEPGGGDEEHHH